MAKAIRWVSLIVICGGAAAAFALGILAGYLLWFKQEPPDEAAVAASQPSGEISVAPGAEVNLCYLFEACGHQKKVTLPTQLTGMTKKEVLAAYPGCTLQSFSNDSVSMLKKVQGYCPQHLVLRLKEGKFLVTRRDETLEDETLLMQMSASYSVDEQEAALLEQGVPFETMEEINAYFESMES